MIDRIREMLARRPFTPFRITLIGGSVADVTNPDMAEITSDVLRLYRPDPDHPGMRLWSSLLALQHVNSVETIEHEYPFIVEAEPCH